MKKAIVLFIALSWIAQPSLGGSDWTSDVPTRTAGSISIPCEGLGPSQDIALKEAIHQCVSMASDQIVGDFDVKSLTIETQRDSGFHEEISTNRSVEGLECRIKKQKVVQNDGSYDTWILCYFDLEKIKLVWSRKPTEPERFIASSNRLLTLVSVPLCDDIIVKGRDPRIVRCNSNPMQFLQKEGDEEYIIRAKDFVPKHVDASEVKDDIVEVYLERQ